MKSKKILILLCFATNMQLTLISREREGIEQPVELVDDQEGNFKSVVIQDTLLVENILKTNKLIVDEDLEAPQVIIDDATILNLTASNCYIDNLNANTLNVSGTSVVGCDVFVDCNLYIPETTASNQGVIFKYSGTTAAPTTTPFLHNAGIDSVFLGENSGNFTGGNANIGIGTATLNNVTNTSSNNIAIGYNVLQQNQGNDNVGIGNLALKGNTVGNGNLALGATALQKVFDGSNNIAIGNAAGANLIGGSRNICIGFFSGSNLGNGFNNIAIGNDANSADNGTIRIGTSGTHTTNFQAGIRGVTAAGAETAVISIDSNGQLGTGIITNSINLTGSTATEGNILKNGTLFIHNYGTSSTFVGLNAGNTTLTGLQNTGIGENALPGLTSGSFNTAIGKSALQSNTTGSNNTAIGVNALVLNTIGQLNTAVGSGTLALNTTGIFNTAVGGGALFLNTTGSNNTAVGVNALIANTTGQMNTAVGFESLKTNDSGTNNIAIGALAGSLITTESSTINIGNQGFPGISNTIFIGSAGTHTTNFQAGIFNAAALAGGTTVYIDGTNRLSTNPSSNKYKEGIAPIPSATLDAFKQLNPVSFTYLGDETQTIQYGFIAEDVDSFLPELIVHDNQGSIYTIKYHLMYALLYAWLKNLQQNQHNLEQHIINQDTFINILRTDLNNAQLLINTLSSRLIVLESLLNLNINS